MNKKQVVSEIGRRTGLTRKEAGKALNCFCDIVSEELVAGSRVQISGFGAFEVRDRAARMGKNPKTGESIMVPATKVPVFKAGKPLKNSIDR